MDDINPDPEFWLRNINVTTDAISLMAVHGNLLLALRHPENTGLSRQYVINFVKQAGEKLIELGALTRLRLIHTYQVEAEQGNIDFLEEVDRLIKLEAALAKDLMKER